MQAESQRRGSCQLLNVGEIHVGTPLRQGERPRRGLKPLCEECYLWQNAFSVNPLFRRGREPYVHFFRRQNRAARVGPEAEGAGSGKKSRPPRL